MISLNTLGQQVIATNSFFYSMLEGGMFETFVCCGEYQNKEYCFAHNTQAGCAFCETNTSAPCECEE